MSAPVTPNEKKDVAPADRERRLARRVMPFIAQDSALLPTDKWIFATLKDAYKTVASFRRDARAAAALALAAGGFLVAVAGAVVTLAVVGTVTLATVAAAGVAACAGGAAAWWRGRNIWRRAAAETLPALKEMIGKRYVAYKTEEMMRVWKERRDAFRAARADAPAKEAAPAAAKAAPTLADIFKRKKTDGAADAAPAKKDANPKPPAL
jgi:hypothetical protein